MPRSATTSDTKTCYDYPQYWDLAFRDETKREAEFIEAACRKYCSSPARRLFEPGCGGGRLVVEMAARGHEVAGIDLSDEAVRYVNRRLRRRGLSADVRKGDMTVFELEEPVDAAFCTFNTFRHLTTERGARQHLQTVAANVRQGGIYVLGLHLIPLDAEEECLERWTARHGRTRVTTSLRVTSFDREERIEVLSMILNVTSANRKLKIKSEFPYRLYTASQFRSLLASVPEWELCDVYDFWYEIDEPLQFDDEISDTVFILRKR